MKIVLIVIDSFGIGEMPDARNFGDEGSNTYINILKKTNVDLPHLKSLGLNNIQGLNLEKTPSIGSFAKMQEIFQTGVNTNFWISPSQSA